MAKVTFSRRAEDAIRYLSTLGLSDLTALVITEDAVQNALIAKFLDRDILHILKTQNLGEIIPGVEVHLFGVEGNYSGHCFALDILNARKPECPPIEDDEIDLTYTFTVKASLEKMAKAKPILKVVNNQGS